MNKDIYPEGFANLNVPEPLEELNKLSRRVTDIVIQSVKNKQKKYQGEIQNQMALIPYTRDNLSEIMGSEGGITQSTPHRNIDTKIRDKAYLLANNPTNLQSISKFYPLVESIITLNQSLIDSRTGMGAINSNSKVWLLGGSYSTNPSSTIQSFDFLQESCDRLGISLSSGSFEGGGSCFNQTGYFFCGYNAPEYKDEFSLKIEKLELLRNSIAPLGINIRKGRKQKAIIPQNRESAWMFGENQSEIERFDQLGETTVMEGASFMGKGFGVLSGEVNFYLVGGFRDNYKEGTTSISKYSIISGSVSILGLELQSPKNDFLTSSFPDKGYLMGGWSNGKQTKNILRFSYLTEAFFSVGLSLDHDSIEGIGATNNVR